MCNMCAPVLTAPTWVDAGIPDSAHERFRSRSFCVDILNRVLVGAGVRVSGQVDTPSITVHGSSGKSVVVPDISAVWAAVESLTSHPLDPLDAALIERLTESTAPHIEGRPFVKNVEPARVDYFGLGGTIASVRGSEKGAIPSLSAADIASSVDGLDKIANVHAHQFLLVPSPEITVEDVLRLRDAISDAVAEGSHGAVITQGTDSIEETAFLLDLLWPGEAPIVFSGAMRNPSLPGSEGAANLTAAVQVATNRQARNLGVLVCLNEEIHCARYVRKTHTSNPATFQSPGLGPIGWVAEGRPTFGLKPIGRTHIPLAAGTRIPPTALVRLSLGDDCRMLESILDLGYEGIVIEAFGGGHVPVAALPLLEKLVTEIPVVLASRAGAGEVLVDTYRFPGSEIELMRMGLIRAGALDGLKARHLLTLGLAAGHDRANLADLFREVGTTTGAVIYEDL